MMRTKMLLVLGLALIGSIALSISVSSAVLPGDTDTALRPTPTAETLPPDYEPSIPSDPEALPDLVVESIQLTPARPYVEQEVLVRVTIKNMGMVDVEPSNAFFLDFYINPPTDDLHGLRGDFYWPVQGQYMKAGASVTFYRSWVFTDSVSFNLWAQVDTPSPPDFPLGHVTEANEDNNIRGPEYVSVRTHYAWVEKDQKDFFRNMASTLDVVPLSGTVGIPTYTIGIDVNGDSALALGVFEEPPTSTWGLSPTIPSSDMPDYNMLHPDIKLNEVETNDQRYPTVHAAGSLVVAVWEDGRNGPIYGKDVYLRWSDDNGDTWYDSLQVNDVGDNDQKHPSVAVSPSGSVVVAWQDHRDNSFDIYVQVFRYSGGNLIRCHANGDCSSACDPVSQACNFRVDTDANQTDQIIPDIAADAPGDFFVVWQDQRNGNDDIFSARSYTSTVPCPQNRGELGYHPHLPANEGAAPEQLYLCWGDDTLIPDAAGPAKQANPSISAVEGLKITGFDYEAIPGDPPELIIHHVYSEPTTFVAVAWEDDREGDTDIYLVYSDDEGETYVFDDRLNDEKPPNTCNNVEQWDPAVATNQWMKEITIIVPVPPYGEATAQIRVPVTTMHIVWQDFRNSTDANHLNDPDIYYIAITAEPDSYPPHSLLFVEEEAQDKINENDERPWHRGAVWQGEPDVAATPSGVTLADSDGYNVFVIWADNRNYGIQFDNVDIYFRLISNVGAPTEFVGGNNISVNDHVRLHDVDLSTYTMYRTDLPPHARQHYPSVASTLVAQWPTIFSGYVYVAWDDDRITDPFADRNIYLARSNLTFGGHYDIFVAPPGAPPDTPGQGLHYGSGAYVSQVFDSGSDETVWYVVDWHAWTDSGTYITIQTRLGNSRAEVLNSDWYPKNYPFPDDAVSIGAPLQGYDAPGQHIVDASGNRFPQARFIQYRINLWARDAAPDTPPIVKNTPCIFDVLLYYEHPPIVLLPAVYKNQAP
jgi:hypothetical protein